MKVPSTLDLRRRRGRPPVDDDGYEYEYVEVDDPDALELGDEWEWVEVEVEGDPEVDPLAPSRSAARRRAGWRRLLAGLPTSEAVADEADDADLDDDVDVRDQRSTARATEPTSPDDLDGEWDEGWDDAEWDHLDAGTADDPIATQLRRDGAGPAVDPRIAARRDEVVQARRSRLRRRLTAVAVTFGLILVLAALTRSPVLDVDQIVVSGTEQAEVDAVASASGITPGTPLLGIDLEAAAAAVRSEPWVLDASVERSWSGTIAITVVERQPVATVNAGDGGWLLVDGGRRVVATSAEAPALPIIDGVGLAAVGEELAPEAQGAIDVAAALTPALRTRVAVVNGADPRAIELTLQPSGRVEFGPATAIDERMRSLQTVFATVDLVCLDTIDLAAGRAVLKRVPGCA